MEIIIIGLEVVQVVLGLVVVTVVTVELVVEEEVELVKQDQVLPDQEVDQL
jgi:hypothetical protein